jgi:hypothetical protein
VIEASDLDLDRVRAAAEELRRELVDDPLALAATVEEPIPIVGPTDELDSWFVALTGDGLLLGFLQLEPDLRLHRYSSFQRMPGSMAGCPPAEAWLDRSAIRERASAAAGGDEVGEPVFGYHGSRDRLAWRVPVAGRSATVYVVGDEVYAEAEP